MTITLNDYPSFLEECQKDRDDILIRENLMRCSVLILHANNETAYFIYLAYRRMIMPKDANQDEIIECKIFMGKVIFGNPGMKTEVQQKITDKMKLIEEDLITLKLQKRNGTLSNK